MTTFAQKAYEFYTALERPPVPAGIEVMNPYQDADAKKYSQLFLDRYFSDHQKRVFVLGINPGRFGAGLTGVTFTDPVALDKFCGISNNFPPRRESSSVFIYQFIERWGGVEKFYRDFFLTAVCPLGFTKEGNNYNFYDHPDLFRSIKPFILWTMSQQLSFGAKREAVIILGSGRNYQIFCDLNEEGNFFKEVYALEHPRFIMQYRQKKIEEYLKKYEEVFSKVMEK